MGKRRNTSNKPKNRPERPRSVDKGTTIDDIMKREGTTMSRRQLITLGLAGLGLAGIAASRMGIFDTVEKEKSTVEKDHLTTEKRPAKAKDGLTLEYEKWASKIKLPTISINHKGTWTQEEMEAYFLKGNLNRDDLEAFYSEFDHAHRELKKEYAAELDAETRSRLLLAFSNRIIKAYSSKIKREAVFMHWNTSEMKLFFKEMNMHLAPHGYRVEVGNDGQFALLTVGQIDRVSSLDIKTADKSKKLPVLLMGDSLDVSNKPVISASDKRIRSQGEYVPEGDYIVADETVIRSSTATRASEIKELGAKWGYPEREVYPENAYELSYEIMVQHEGMHAYNHGLLGLKGYTEEGVFLNDALKQHGEIDMGHYKLREENYKGVSNMQLDELIGIGSGLAHSDKLALATCTAILTIKNPNYRFAEHILVTEIMQSNSVDLRLRREIEHNYNKLKRIVAEPIGEALFQMSDKELQGIGKRMVKLGIHLTQGE